MDKSFVIILVAIAVIAFSSSAYIFSENQIIENVNMQSVFSSDRTEYINKINKCLDENTTVDGSITLNSFTALCKEHYKEWKKETKDDRDLERSRYDRF